MVDTIYIARHGFRMNWVTTNWQSVTGLPRDPPLTAFGESQAQELAEHFLSLPLEERPTAIFSSPYYRCLQTSRPTAKALNLPIYIDHGLSEWYSQVIPGTGLHPRPGSAEFLKKWFPEIDESWTTVYYPSRKGENVEEHHKRAAGFVEVLVPEVERRFSGKHQRILLVSHAATIISMTRALVGDPTLPVRPGTCSLTVVARKDGAEQVLGGWEAKAITDAKHLKDGALRDWGFEDIEIAGNEVVPDRGEPGSENEVDEPVGPQVGDVAISKM